MTKDSNPFTDSIFSEVRGLVHEMAEISRMQSGEVDVPEEIRGQVRELATSLGQDPESFLPTFLRYAYAARQERRKELLSRLSRLKQL